MRMVSFGLLITAIASCLATPRGESVSDASRSPVLQGAGNFDPRSVSIYVSEFELHAVPRAEVRTSGAANPANPAGAAGTPKSAQDEAPVKRAQALVDSMRAALIVALEKAGYKPQPTPGERPLRGVEIRGVFGEADEQNRVRRAILGSGSRATRFLLYVGVANLAKPEQPLYQAVVPNAAVPGAADSRYGPVITITSYAPVSKFELNKDPTQDDIQKVAQDLAAQLDQVLRANALALAQ